MEREHQVLEILKSEYEEIKHEQAQRIGFRDNMIFVQLVAVGSVGSWVLTNQSNANTVYALLVIPWICIVLGWTYIANDYAISQIGKYVREHLAGNAIQMGNGLKGFAPHDLNYFYWERFHRGDKRRRNRKTIQWLVDELTFFAPGILGIVSFCYLRRWDIFHFTIILVLAVELSSTLFLAFVITRYSDFGIEKITQENAK